MVSTPTPVTLSLPSSISFECEGGIKKVSVPSNATWSDDSPWLSCSRASNSEMIVSAVKNQSSYERTGIITIEAGGISKKITVKQAGLIPMSTLTIDIVTPTPGLVTLSVPPSVSFECEGGIIRASISSNGTWSVSDDSSWLGCAKASNSEMILYADKNQSLSPRTGTITVKSEDADKTMAVIKTIAVTQGKLSLKNKAEYDLFELDLDEAIINDIIANLKKDYDYVDSYTLEFFIERFNSRYGINIIYNNYKCTFEYCGSGSIYSPYDLMDLVLNEHVKPKQDTEIKIIKEFNSLQLGTDGLLKQDTILYNNLAYYSIHDNYKAKKVEDKLQQIKNELQQIEINEQRVKSEEKFKLWKRSNSSLFYLLSEMVLLEQAFTYIENWISFQGSSPGEEEIASLISYACAKYNISIEFDPNRWKQASKSQLENLVDQLVDEYYFVDSLMVKELEITIYNKGLELSDADIEYIRQIDPVGVDNLSYDTTNLASLLVSFIPVVGDVYDVICLVTGKDVISGEILSPTDQLITSISIFFTVSDGVKKIYKINSNMDTAMDIYKKVEAGDVSGTLVYSDGIAKNSFKNATDRLISEYGDEAAKAINKYGDDAIEAMNNGIGPDLISKLDDLGIKPSDYKGLGIVNKTTAEAVDNITRVMKGTNVADLPNYSKYVKVYNDYAEFVLDNGAVVKLSKADVPGGFGKLDDLITGYDSVTQYGVDTYNAIRNSGLDDIADVARNTGLSIDEVTELKKHLFLVKHQLPMEGGYVSKLDYFTADEEIAYAWSQAQIKDLSPSQKSWFRQLCDHELEERKLMYGDNPIMYRNIDSWNGTKYTDTPPGAHDLASAQPEFGTFEGFEEFSIENNIYE